MADLGKPMIPLAVPSRLLFVGAIDERAICLQNLAGLDDAGPPLKGWIEVDVRAPTASRGL